jgi:hypothetical protein
MFVFPPFALKQKVEPKIQGKPKWLRLFCRPRTATPNFFLYYSLAYYRIAAVLTIATFSNAHSGSEEKCSILQALYPALLFL